MGIDGGGTKTDFLVLNETGKTVRKKRIRTILHKHIRMDKVVQLLRENVKGLLDGIEDNAYICLVFPNWGESMEMINCRSSRAAALEEVSSYFAAAPFFIPRGSGKR